MCQLEAARDGMDGWERWRGMRWDEVEGGGVGRDMDGWEKWGEMDWDDVRWMGRVE